MSAASASNDEFQAGDAPPADKFPILAAVGLAACCLIAATIISAFVLPVILPEAMTRAGAERLLSGLVGKPLTITGTHSFRLLPKLQLAATGLQSVESGGAVRTLQIGKFEIEMSAIGVLRGEVDFDRILVSEPLIEIKLADQGPASAEKSTAGDVNLAWGWWRDMSIGDLRVVGGQAVYSNGSRTPLLLKNISLKSRPAKLAGDNDRAAGEKKPGLIVEGKAQLNNAEITLNIETSDLRLYVTGNRWPVQVSLTSALLGMEFKGAFAARDRVTGAGKFSASGPDVGALEGWIGEMLPISLGGAFSVSGNVNLTREIMQIRDIALAVGGAEAIGQFDITGIESGVPVVDGRIKARVLNIATALTGSISSFSLQRIPVGIIDLQWDELHWQTLRFGSGHFSVERAADRPRIQLTLSDTKLSGGTARGQIVIDTAEGLHALQGGLRFVNVDLEAISSAHGSALPIRGRVSIDGNLLSVGAGVDELMQAMQGRVEITASAGSINLPMLADILTPALDGQVPFQALNATFNVAHGVARTEDIILKGTKLSVVGSGQFDLATHESDIEFKKIDGNGGTRGMRTYRLRGAGSNWSVEKLN